MAGILKTGSQYKRSATTGAVTGAGHAASRETARKGLDIQRRGLEQAASFQERELKLKKEAAKTARNMTATGTLGMIIGAYFGGPLGASIGGALGSTIGGMF
jgi:hypothetical protein